MKTWDQGDATGNKYCVSLEKESTVWEGEVRVDFMEDMGLK